MGQSPLQSAITIVSIASHKTLSRVNEFFAKRYGGKLEGEIKKEVCFILGKPLRFISMKKKNRAKICGYRTPSDFIRRRVRELAKLKVWIYNRNRKYEKKRNFS